MSRMTMRLLLPFALGFAVLSQASAAPPEDALAQVRSRFTLREAWTDHFGNPGERLVLRFQAKTLPESITFYAGLRLSDGKPEGLTAMLDAAESHAALLNAMPWLIRFARRPGKLTIGYVNGGALGDDTMANFAKDMHALGRDALAAEVRAVRGRAAFLTAGISQDTALILLPDRRAVLWRFGAADTAPFPLPGNGKDCPSDGRIGSHCIGLVVGADGKPLRD
jgi:hypothetical protein